MQLRADQLDSQLAKSLAPLYVIHGDEPLLALAAADAIRAAARRQGCSEREVFTAERGFDWSELAQAGASQSLFGDRKIVELRIPTGKPGTAQTMRFANGKPTYYAWFAGMAPAEAPRRSPPPTCWACRACR